MTAKPVSKSTNHTDFKLQINVYLVALKVHLMVLQVIKGEGALQYWPFPETYWHERQQFLVQYQACKDVQLGSLRGWGAKDKEESDHISD